MKQSEVDQAFEEAFTRQSIIWDAIKKNPSTKQGLVNLVVGDYDAEISETNKVTWTKIAEGEARDVAKEFHQWFIDLVKQELEYKEGEHEGENTGTMEIDYTFDFDYTNDGIHARMNIEGLSFTMTHHIKK